ncbi:MAG: hypothetical protein A2W25_08555 [candidate division Zixibacteria bacterium RBG_16_53_22]|nr:MAG: hypothetical protein A2W25_08555 [candidate division Zixibacteria bacterium RBG_16_53_22]
MPNTHPVLAHFTIALFVAAVVFDLIGYFTKNESLKTAGRWNLLLASISAISSVITGLSAARVLPHNKEVHRIMETHELIGLIVLGILILLVIWRIFVRGSFPAKFGWLFLTIGVIGISLVLTGGYLGGELVYRHGLGVAPMMESFMSEHSRSAHERDSVNQITGERDEVHFICPVHPEVVSDKPGLCPKCGAALIRTENDSLGEADEESPAESTEAESHIHIHKDGEAHSH